MKRAYSKACAFCGLLSLVAKIGAYTTLAIVLVYNVMLIAKIIAVLLIVAIGWPLIKALKCYVAARILLAKLVK